MKYIFYAFAIILGFYFHKSSIICLIILIPVLYFGYKKLRSLNLAIFFILLATCALVAIPKTLNQNEQRINKIGIVTEAKDNYYIIKTSNVSFYVYSKNNGYEFFDIVKIEGKLKPLEMHSIESEFNFKSYLNNSGVFYECIVENASFIYRRILRNKQISDSACRGLSTDSCSLVKSLLFARNEQSEIRGFTDLLGISYLFIISGVGLNFILKIIETIVKALGITKRNTLIKYALLAPIALLIGHRFVVWRLYSIAIIRHLTRKNSKTSYVRLIFYSFIIFLFLDYHLIYQMKFYLPYLMSLVFMLTKASKKMPILIRISGVLIIYLLLSVVILGEFELSMTSFLLRLIIMPFLLLVSLILCLSVINIIPQGLINQMSLFLKNALKFLSAIDIKIVVGVSSILFTIIMIGVFLLYLYFLSIKNKRNIIYTVIILLIFVTGKSLGLSSAFIKSIHFIDVGQGDSILINNGLDHILIDTGGSINKDLALTTLIPYLKKQRINCLDAVIISHDDYDHSGALQSLQNNYCVQSVKTKRTVFPYRIGDLEIINLNHNLYTNDNDNSLVLFFEFMNKKWLMMGDAGKEVEESILRNYRGLRVDYIKLGHHGSKTSSSVDFLEATKPSEAIISAGYNNRYNHPSKEVINTLNMLKIKIRRTDIEGTIVYQTYSL